MCQIYQIRYRAGEYLLAEESSFYLPLTIERLVLKFGGMVFHGVAGAVPACQLTAVSFMRMVIRIIAVGYHPVDSHLQSQHPDGIPDGDLKVIVTYQLVGG